MILAALLAGLLLWLSFGTAVFRDRDKWPALAAVVIGLAALAKGHPFVGGALIVGGSFLLRQTRPLFSRRSLPANMDAAQARALLGVERSAGRDDVLAAHRRLIARNHPDSGGTEGLAAQLNAARDVLLDRLQKQNNEKTEDQK